MLCKNNLVPYFVKQDSQSLGGVPVGGLSWTKNLIQLPNTHVFWVPMKAPPIELPLVVSATNMTNVTVMAEWEFMFELEMTHSIF
jgi:hypothetical protein